MVFFFVGTSSMTPKLTGEGAEEAEEAVKKKALQFSAINSDFWA